MLDSIADSLRPRTTPQARDGTCFRTPLVLQNALIVSTSHTYKFRSMLLSTHPDVTVSPHLYPKRNKYSSHLSESW